MISSFIYAQRSPDCYFKLYRHDAGIIGGATYYMGDFNERLIPLLQSSYYGGLMYRFHFNTQHSLRAQVSYGCVRGDATFTKDALPDPTGNNWKFNRQVVFADVMGEIGFTPLDVIHITKKQQRLSPFILLGVGYILSITDHHYASPLQDRQSNKIRQYLSIPVGVGLKYVIAKRYTIGVDWIIRKTFADDMDNYNDPTPAKTSWINTDWLCNMGVTLAYRIPEWRACAAYPYKKKRLPMAGSIR